MVAMEKGVADCRAVIVVLTDDGKNPYWSRDMCIKEVQWARKYGKTIIPVVSSEW